MKVLILLCLATVAVASVYEVPVVKTVVVDSYEPSIILSPKVSSGLYLQSVGHPALLGLHPVKKYVSHYPSGLYHGPHGLGIYNPKLHDELEEAYYRG